ncbi:hypothetical protein IT571_03235 [Candidatus Sumerlaeota bacterium]|nr:hypothetical protein [Candidatus Sumerlaeota bacterium]HMZ50974.1 hypothetical protein [Candidatus Sumerlaeota bacterium]HNM45933.1 hypothetical protein [Candidatus Sumerlaeota bacterium]
MMKPEEEKQPEGADVIDVARRDSARDAQIEELHRRLQRLESSRNGENVRLAAMFLLGMSAGISLTLLYLDVMRKFF